MMAKRAIELLDLSREYDFLKKDIKRELNACLKVQSWVLGPKLAEFEKALANYLGVKFAVGVASGTDALVLSLHALSLSKKKKVSFDSRDEIITTPFTFVATAEAILRSGARPVFVDINPHTFNIDPKAVEKAVSKKTIGIMPVHLYGLGSNISDILRIAKRYNLFVVEDVAQSLGGMYRNKKLGTFGDTGAFSFFPSKNLGAWGDAGLVATNNKALAENIRILRNHGQRKKYNSDYLAYNSRLDSIQAAVLLAKLKYIDKFNRLRRKAAHAYTKALQGLGCIEPPFEPRQSYHVYHLYSIKVSSRRDQLLRFLNSKGIGARLYYPLPLYKMKAFRSAKCRGSFKATKHVLSRVLSLPIHPFLERSQIDYVVSTIKKFFQK